MKCFKAGIEYFRTRRNILNNLYFRQRSGSYLQLESGSKWKPSTGRGWNIAAITALQVLSHPVNMWFIWWQKYVFVFVSMLNRSAHLSKNCIVPFLLGSSHCRRKSLIAIYVTGALKLERMAYTSTHYMGHITNAHLVIQSLCKHVKKQAHKAR